MAAAKGDHMDRSLQEREDGREGEKEGEEGGPAAEGRGSPTATRSGTTWWLVAARSTPGSFFFHFPTA